MNTGTLFCKQESGEYTPFMPLQEVEKIEQPTKFTQIGDVLWHLQTYGSITSMEAILDYGATRISAIIYVLRKRGHKIESKTEKGKTRYGRPTSWARYVYKGKVENEH